MKKELSRLARSLEAEGTVLERLLLKHLVSDFTIRNYWRRLQRKPDFQKNLLKKLQNILLQRTAFCLMLL